MKHGVYVFKLFGSKVFKMNKLKIFFTMNAFTDYIFLSYGWLDLYSRHRKSHVELF